MPFAGPREGRIVATRRLPHAQKKDHVFLCVGDDGDIRATCGPWLARLTTKGGLVWERRLHRFAQGHAANAPVALRGGATLVVCAGGPVVILAPDGRTSARIDVDEPLDDSGPAAQITREGELVLTAMTGEVFQLGRHGRRHFGEFGYDIVPPAIDAEDGLIVAGYARGLFRTGKGIPTQRFPGIHDPDLLPVVKPDGTVAVGSLNEECSVFFDGGQRLIGRFPFAAAFSDAGVDRWIALWKSGVACLVSDGTVLWQETWQDEIDVSWGRLQSLVAPSGDVYIPHPSGLLALAADGSRRFLLPLQRPITGLAPVAEGRLAVGLRGGTIVNVA
jgi:hypothetical protein